MHNCLSLFEQNWIFCCQKTDGKSELISAIYDFAFNPRKPKNESLFTLSVLIPILHQLNIRLFWPPILPS